MSQGVWGVVDLTSIGLEEMKTLCDTWGLAYVRVELGITPYLRAADKSLTSLRKAPDAALIFQSEEREYFMFQNVNEIT